MTDETAQTFQGRVKWFNPRSGFGFITLLDADRDEDVFVHHSGLTTQKECFKTLYQGEYVSLSIKEDENGKHCVGSGSLKEVARPKGNRLR